MDYKQIPTTKEVVAVLFASHKDTLVAGMSYSNPDGNCPYGHGKPEMLTGWYIPNSPIPLFITRHTWDGLDEKFERINEKFEQWLCFPLEEE